ncbi:PAAR domain-containing protein [Xenorhabdus bovienii]|uniref:PAAR domain-containing protein n=1 Tax=Xenorhabdus bovienii str. kraussei Becker Underwood TaxID=1398204 RepID=A0A077PT89_XENBV|nr:PAAR domain-containing protein [Xenorhabdus bovienii]CDH24228.1 conserved hypothetical protein [Xenorhabdus bovienii str. kraussei Becker Underwood]
MTGKAVILLNDITDHGSKVITSIGGYTYQGISVAGESDLVTCPKCKGKFPIIEGSKSLKSQGKLIAQKGMQTACRA